jgi:hypothetical protein
VFSPSNSTMRGSRSGPEVDHSQGAAEVDRAERDVGQQGGQDSTLGGPGLRARELRLAEHARL